MAKGRPATSSTSSLPCLTTGGPTRTAVSSPSLRGSYHSKVPEISNQPLNTLLPILKNGVEHPQPYYMTQKVVLRAPDVVPVWKESSNCMELLHYWNANVQFREAYVEKILADVIHPLAAKIANTTISEEKATSKSESQILGWIEEILVGFIFERVTEICLETLWDSARKLRVKEIKELDETYLNEDPDPWMTKILRNNYKSPLTRAQGDNLINYRWETLLYYTNTFMQRGSLGQNYAIMKLEEKVITQVAAAVFVSEALNLIEKEIELLDENERFELPHRKRPELIPDEE